MAAAQQHDEQLVEDGVALVVPWRQGRGLLLRQHRRDVVVVADPREGEPHLLIDTLS